MMDFTKKIAGWYEIKKQREKRAFCPYCNNESDGFSYDENDIVECFNCNKKFDVKKGIWKNVKKEVFVCANCKRQVVKAREYLSKLGYVCPCGNLLATIYDNELVQPLHVLERSWNSNFENIIIWHNSNLLISEIVDPKSKISHELLIHLAKIDDISFRYSVVEHARTLFIFDKKSIIGYLSWTEKPFNKGNITILSQIYILPNQRSKGFGTLLTKVWVEHVADKINMTFIVESPNSNFQRILFKLGYWKETAKQIQYIKCKPVRFG